MNNLRIFIILLSYLCTVINCVPLKENDMTIEEKVLTPNIYRLPNDTVPIHYNVRFNINFDNDNLDVDGEVTVDFEVRELTSNVVLHSKFLVINESATKLETKTGNVIMPIQHDYNNETEMLYVRFNDSLKPDTYKLSLKYKKTEDDVHFQGLYRSFYTTEQKETVYLAATHFQPIFARRAFPCWDEPALKATFNISIKHFSNYTALSNMPVYTSEYDEKDQKLWSHFETTPIMSTNILGFVVADYTHISNSDGTVKVWTKNNSIANTEYVLEIAEKATIELTGYLNNTIRVPKTDHVTVPHYSSRATENWGLIVYQENALIYNAETDIYNSKMHNILTIVHELAHQWFGNLVSPSWWKYFWMSEGMATYLKYYITDKMFKDWRLMDELVVNVQQGFAFLVDDNSIVVPLNNDFSRPIHIMTRDNMIIYQKSTAILRMLSHIVSEEIFRCGLIKYINAHEYSSVTSDDLWKAMQDALDESDMPHKGFSVKKVMDTWVEQTGYPLVTVTQDYTTGTITLRQEISPTNNDKRPKKWWIPLHYATKSEPNFTKTIPSLWLTPEDKKVTIEGVDVDDWIIVNLQEAGYYRVNYDPVNWRKIAKYLNSDDYIKIHHLNRAQIIHDSFHLMMSNRLNPPIFIELTNYLSREIDYIPWTSAISILSEITTYLKHPIGDEILKPHILGLMHNLVEHVGYDERPDDTVISRRNRKAILTWACKLGHRKCKEKATDDLVAYLENPETIKIPLNHRFWTFCIGLMKANHSTVEKFFDLEKNYWKYRTLRYLGCSEDPAIIENYLNLAISNGSSALNQYITDIFAFLDNDLLTNTDVELNYLINNWERIKNHVPNHNAIIESLIWSINTRESFDKLKTFLDKNKLTMFPQLSYREDFVEKVEKNVLKIRTWFNREIRQEETDNSVTVSTST